MNQKNKARIILIGIVIVGILLRIIFAIRLEVDNLQIDLGSVEGQYDEIMNMEESRMKEAGHLAYIITIYRTGHLPDTNANQFYHPPLSQAMFAGFMKLENLFTNNSKILIESLEFLCIFYSVLIIFVCYKILREIGFEEKDTILPISIITFHPLFIFLSRLINTDELLVLLLLLSVLYLIKWYQNPSYKNVLILALVVGLSTMTKTSAIVMALPLVIVFLKKIIMERKDKGMLVKLFCEAFLFSTITLPMTFWYPIRNYIKFGQKMFGVAEALEELKVEDYSFFARWIPNHEFFNWLYNKNASNVWSNLIISSINFSLGYINEPYILSIVLRILSVIIAGISIFAMFRFYKNEEKKSSLLILLITFVSWIIGYIYFNISMPYSCTMHARYILIAFYISIFYIGIFYKNIKNSNIKYIVLGLSVLFILLSILLIVYLTVIGGETPVEIII